MQRIMFVAIALVALIAGRVEATVERDSFGSTGDGQAVERYTLENGSGALSFLAALRFPFFF